MFINGNEIHAECLLYYCKFQYSLRLCVLWGIRNEYIKFTRRHGRTSETSVTSRMTRRGNPVTWSDYW